MSRQLARSAITLSLAITLLTDYLLLQQGRSQAAQELKGSTSDTHYVSSSADAGPGSLRQALQEAASGDSILFQAAVFPPTSPVTITLTSRLPAITEPDLTIDASQAGVVLDGSAAGGDKTPGLEIQANGVVVRGLQIVNFSGCGIELRGQNNIVGGERGTGSGPLGQGNLLSGNQHSGVCLFEGGNYNTVRGNFFGLDVSGLKAWGSQGDGVHINGGHHNLIEGNIISSQTGSGVQVCCTPLSSYNTLQNNLIGVGRDGTTALPCFNKGVSLSDGAQHNTIGPGNVIADTAGSNGVSIAGGLSPANTILGNSIYDNLEGGILLWNENLGLVAAPVITAFNLGAGVVTGLACPNCLVQVYSDEANEGRIFEGQATADANGHFVFSKGTVLSGPHLTATATDAEGATSMFSVPTVGSKSVPLQAGNSNPFSRLATLSSSQSQDSRIGFYVQEQGWVDMGMVDATVLNRLGVKMARGQMNDPDSYLVNFQTDELLIHENFDQMISQLEAYGIEMAYNLLFWDKEHYRQTGGIDVPRFQSEAEVQRYLDFVRVMVRAFGDRVDTWEIWNEPSFEGSYQWILVDDYIDLARRAIPVIRAEDPGARIIVGSHHGWDEEQTKDYFYKVLESDLMPIVDVISWHPFLVHLDDAECGGELFDRYPQILAEIKSIAAAHGFTGEFRADELRFSTSSPSFPGPCAVDDRTAGKYYAREILRHLGEDVASGVIMNGETQLQVYKRLATLIAGAQASSFPLEISASTNVISYTYSLPGGGRMAAVWKDVHITPADSGSSATLRLPGLANYRAYGIDVLGGVEQPLMASVDEDDLVIQGLLLRDYPLLVRLAPPEELYVPLLYRFHR